VTYVESGNRYFRFKDRISGAITTIQYGSATSIPVPADYDLDFKTNVAVIETLASDDLQWNILGSDGTTTTQVLGKTGDVPVPSDYNGDGKAEVAVYTPVVTGGGGVWTYLDQSVQPPVTVQRTFGIANGVAVNSPLQFRLPPVTVPTPPTDGSGSGSGSGNVSINSGGTLAGKAAEGLEKEATYIGIGFCTGCGVMRTSSNW